MVLWEYITEKTNVVKKGLPEELWSFCDPKEEQESTMQRIEERPFYWNGIQRITKGEDLS